jgi:hypothetical protein
MEASGQLRSLAALTVEEGASGTHWIGGWLGPTAGLEAVDKIETLPLPGFKPQPSSL